MRSSPFLRRALAAAAWLAATAAAAQPAVDVSPVAATSRGSPLDPHWHRGAFMEIFVRAWKDSDGDGIGDLRGLTSTLDYLKDLGIRGIWLMPITANADGDHGYATTDFRAIAPEYGTLADFDELMRQAHRRGIGVIMDYVINHAAAEHPMFVAARQGPQALFRDWFVWSEERPAGWDIWGKVPWYHTASEPWLWKGQARDLPPPPPDARGFYFGTFGPHMPDFNFGNPAVLDYHVASLRFWLERGLDGYRLDAVPHLVENSASDWNNQPQSRAITKRLQDEIKAYQHRYVVCEATAEPQQYGDPAVCGGAFAFGHVQHYIEATRGKPESVQAVAGYYTAARDTMATFLSNHDIFAGRRVWDQLEGNESRMRLAAAAYLLQPGTPFVYYGEEIGMAGVPGLAGDRPLRAPMSWTADATTAGFTTGTPFRPLAPNAGTHNVAAQLKDPRSLHRWYRTMIGLRNAHPSISRGSYERPLVQGGVAGWQRRIDEPGGAREHSVALINYGADPGAARIEGLPAGARLVSVHPAGGATAARADAQGVASLLLAPRSVRVLLVQTGPAKGAAQPAAGKSKPAKPARKAAR
jgi:alpha-amylase